MYFNKILRLSLILCLIALSIQCKKSNNSYKAETENSYSNENGFSDGTYCAEIDYYYSETGTYSTYTLLVEIENNELTVIHWPNGGWLDRTHFTPPDISSGEATFTSDNGVDYTARIIGNEGDCSTSLSAFDEDDLVRQKEDEETEYRNRQDVEDEYRKKQEEDENEE